MNEWIFSVFMIYYYKIFLGRVGVHMSLYNSKGNSSFCQPVNLTSEKTDCLMSDWDNDSLILH